MRFWNGMVFILNTLPLVLASSSWASIQKSAVLLDEGSGSVEFHAIGRPSAIKIVGKGEKPRGKLTIEGRSVRGEAIFALKSLETGIAMRDRHMKEKYLDVTHYPEARLKVEHLEMPRNLDDGAKEQNLPFVGSLSLHGTEKTVNGSASVERRGNQLMFAAQFGLRIADHGIEIPSFAGITMADEVQVVVQDSAPLTPIVEARAKFTKSRSK